MDRGENQQRGIEAIFKRLTKPSVAIHYMEILDAMTGTFRSNISPDVILQLFSRQVSLGGDWTIEKMAAKGTPDSRPTYSMGSQELSVLIPDEASLAEIRDAIRQFMKG
jgi:anionic cell wall polymer biosynthesis LytR-Cps2A-Psr (LCP) family protein